MTAVVDAQPVRAVLVGYGYWGSRFLNIARRVDALEIVGVVDPRFGDDEFAGPTALSGWRELSAALSAVRCDAAIVTTPASAHAEPIRQALRAGKHVFTEKPFTVTTEDSAELLDLARDGDLMLTVDHQYWWSAEVAALGKALADNAIGEVVAVAVERAADGPVRYDVDALWDLAIHDISILVRLGVLGEGDKPCLEVEECRQTMDGQVAGCVALTGRTPSAITVRVHACWISRTKRRGFVIAGERGSLRLEETDRYLSAWLIRDGRRMLLSRSAKSGSGTPIERALEEFAAGVRGTADLRKAVDAARVVTAIAQIEGSARQVATLVRSPRCWL
ncbi:Gfo/Idh/MocA family protein [Nocardia sp. NPDC052566]|uniref:Gfo/Idh/MocA family protein n=1 Tax=Nocardia sp. NPDC052566 TaxID=3364330 RepID=UPI0037C7F98C